MNGLLKAASWAVAGLVVVNACAGVGYLLVERQLESARRPAMSAIGGKFPAFSGVDVSGQRWVATDAPCRIVRVTADSCEFCGIDKPAYEALLDVAREARCEVIELSPRAGQMARNERLAVVQLSFVDTDLGSVLAPFVAPQTIILDGAWTMKWIGRGMFSENTLASSMATVRSLAVD